MHYVNGLIQGIGLGPIHCVKVSFTLGTMLDMMQDATLTLSLNKVSQVNWVTWHDKETFILEILGTFAVLCVVWNGFFCVPGN